MKRNIVDRLRRFSEHLKSGTPIEGMRMTVGKTPDGPITKMDRVTMTVAPNDSCFRREYAMPVGKMSAVCLIPAPGGKVSPDDARDMIEWLNMIIRRLERDIENGRQNP